MRQAGDAQLKPYDSWVEFAANLKNPASIINFVAAYGTTTRSRRPRRSKASAMRR